MNQEEIKQVIEKATSTCLHEDLLGNLETELMILDVSAETEADLSAGLFGDMLNRAKRDASLWGHRVVLRAALMFAVKLIRDEKRRNIA